jgi:hypothetical protein
MNRRTGILLLLASALVSASELDGQSRDCRKEKADSAHAVALGVHRGCEVDRSARLQSDMRVRPMDLDARIQCHKVALDFVVDTLGIPEVQTARLISTNSDGLAEAVRAALGSLRYRPAQLDNLPVRQLVLYEMKMRVRVTISSSPRGPSGAASGRAPGC